MNRGLTDIQPDKGTVRKKTVKISAGTILIIIFLAVYVPVIGRWIFTDTVKTDVLKQGSIEESVNATGVIMRNETAFSSDIDGKYVYEVVESKKVPKGFTIASVINSSGETVLDQIKALNTRIRDAEVKNIENNEMYSDDLQRIDDQIKEQVDSLVIRSFENDFKYSDNQRRQLDSIIGDKAGLGGNTADSPEVKELKSELASLESAKQADSFKIVAGVPGTVSYVIDGYENVLSPDKPESLTPEIFEKIRQEKDMNSAQTDIVTKGKPFVKLITGDYIYIGTYIDESTARKLKSLAGNTSPSGNNISLRINDAGKSVEATVNSVADPSAGKCLVTFKTNDLGMETSQLRKLNIDIILKKVSGLEVPLNSLIDYKKYGDSAKIMMVEDAVTKIENVKCTGDDGTFAIIEAETDNNGRENVSLYDKFVTDPQKVKEGQMITK